MLDPALLPAFFALFGQVGGSLLKKAAEKHAEKLFGEVLDKAGNLGKKSAVEEALERAYGYWIEATLGYLKALGYEEEDLEAYKESFSRLLEDSTLGEELAKPLLHGDGWQGLDALAFDEAWKRSSCAPLPETFQWSVALSAFRRHVQKQRVLTPELQAALNAENLQAILDEIRQQSGVRSEGNERRYAERMRLKYHILDLAALAPATYDDTGNLQLREVFLAPDVRENPPQIDLPRDLLRKLAEQEGWNREGGELPEDVAKQQEVWKRAFAEQRREPVLEAIGRADNRLMVLLGDPGSGKSTLTRYLLLSILEPPRDAATGQAAWTAPWAGHLPLLIELRELMAARSGGHCQTFLEFLDHLGKSQSYHLDEVWLDGRLRDEPALVLFDGLDEIFDPAERERVSQEIAGFADRYPRARIIVTSRPIGYSAHVLKGAGFRHFALQDLDDAQVEAFVRGWFRLTIPARPEEASERVERILRAMRQSRSVRLLAGNPMLLTIMALMARQQELPRERARFYEYAADVLCHHWDVNRHLRDAGVQAEYLGLDDKREILRRIAWRMQSAPEGLAGNFLAATDLREELEGYLCQRYQLSPGEGKHQAEVLLGQLRSRNYVLCLYGPGLYGFVHRTFLEYFCAVELTRRVHQDPEYPIERLIEDIVGQHWQDPAWHEVLRLICGMVGDVYAGMIIEYLTREANPDWRAEPERRIPKNLVLATRCLSEVRNRHSIEDTCLRLLKAIVELYETPDVRPWNLEEGGNILWEAAQEVGPVWPGSTWFRSQLVESLITRTDDSWLDGHALLATALFPQDRDLQQELFELALQADRWRLRDTALFALANTWPGETRVRQFVQQRAEQDKEEEVRSRALETLVQTWRDEPSVREFLRHRAALDEAPVVRRLALGKLSWGQDDRLRSLLRGLALVLGSPWLDPLEPVSSRHLRQAAQASGLTEEESQKILADFYQSLGLPLVIGP
ncbi:MAG TPA: NACHT domain-containing protein [Thermoanaerobaculia bacterium]|jgi:hypothetical protein|nr:NACHT domain-containing protein [Thermoanaerobaculia bacterium]